MNAQGTSADQDNRFSDKEKKLLKQMKFEDVVMTTKVDLSKVKLDVIKPWITKRVAALLGMEDDVIVEFIFNQLEDEKVKKGGTSVCPTARLPKFRKHRAGIIPTLFL